MRGAVTAVGEGRGEQGMRVGGRRVVVIPPEASWGPTYRVRACLAMLPCGGGGGGACPLDSQPAVAVVQLVGYRR
jgi:hypothetical protein